MKTGRDVSAFRRARPVDPPADEVALRALAFLSLDEDRLSRFLALTGLAASDIGGLVAEPAFRLAVLDHLAGDESLLLAFAEAEGLAPEAIGRARRALGGGDDF
jgi:hypothetical protein